MLICGIDEAGRGPVIGPLVICGAMMEEKELVKLEQMKVKESKQLTFEQRGMFFGKLKKILKYKAIIIEPKEIDEAVQGKDGLNLNWLEGLKSAEIINGLKPDRAILDCPSPNTGAYSDFVRNHLENKETELAAEHKADVNYPIVAAASIIAKVMRDAEISKLKEKYGELGSGYPADPITKEFMNKNWNKHPEIFRHSWQPYKQAKNGKAQAKLTEFD